MPSDFDDTLAQGDGVHTLPADAQELYHTLTREGATWRADAAPEIARVNQRLRARIKQLDAAQHVERDTQRIAQTLATANAPSTASATDRRAPIQPPSAPQRFLSARRWATTGATLAVVAAFLATLALAATHRPTSDHQKQTIITGAPQTTTAPLGSWTELTSLDSSAVFSANDPTVIAPSDPQVVYETLSQGMQQREPASMRATSDGGKTWRTLTLPVPADHIGYLGAGVSPINPQTVFLSLIDTTPADCPTNRLEQWEGNGQFCRLQYTSLDGGASWRMTDLPLADGSHPGLLTASVNSGLAGPIQSATARVVGQRLFAGFLCTDFSCTRLVTSSDGGQSWSFADQAMRAGGAVNVCDYIVSATGATLYAVTSTTDCSSLRQAPLTLWSSSDAGATWAKVSQLATPNERGMVLTQNSATGAALLYMGLPRTTSLATDKMGGQYPIFSQSPSDVRVSVDGGQTWQQAPTAGIPADHAVYLQMGLLGALRDGSVVVDVIPPSTADPTDASNFDGSDLYAWRPGDAAWQKLASVPREIDNLLITPAQSGGDTIYAVLVNRGGSGSPAPTFAVIRQDIGR